ncbi:MAG: SDR family oxidoreductase [Ruminococcus sp.]|nr:SDR family oxidoreductase [Ruminococcus sp.]
MSKTVLITGASRGIGAACADRFAKEGYNVVINYHSSRTAESLAKHLTDEYGVKTLCAQADIGKRAECEEMIEKAIKEFGFIDVLVNNAGISLSGLFTVTKEDEWERVISTNLSSVYYSTKAVLPHMIREHKGAIVNIASMWGEVGASCEVAYSASKAGVIGLTKALAKEVAPSGIRVNAVSPGVILTDMMKEYDEETLNELKDETPLSRLGTPRDIADAVFFLSGDQAEFITGQILSVNGGFVI